MKTNKVPFSDDAELVKVINTEDAEGYTTRTEETTDVICSISNGVARTEMYEAMKAGVKLSATAEIWEDDYEQQQILVHEGVRYNIIRVYPTGHGTLELSLAQEVH